jgi:signal transduction histidine kinase/CheY-like chemotaxis protein
VPNRTAREGHRVFIAAPYGRDALSTRDVLVQSGYDAYICSTLSDIAVRLDEQTGVLVLTEEVLLGETETFKVALAGQPAWSDVPIVMLAAKPTRSQRSSETLRIQLSSFATNVIVLERPLGSQSLLSAIASALRARQKQFEMRDRLADLVESREALRASRDQLAQQSSALEILNRIGTQIAAELDQDKLVQMVVDAGVALTGAQFGAFFYNVISDDAESYTLYRLSGAPKEAFETFPMPRNTLVFDPTFKGEGIVRSDDITLDPRYGKNSPYNGMPEGHLPVRSYLAVPVTSRDGQVVGGLFFGHEREAVFTERVERLMMGLSGQAAIGIDNARLFQATQRHSQTLEERVQERTAALNLEMETRAKTEEALRQSQKMEAVGQLTGGIAHDFNNLLTGIMGAINIIRRRIATGRLDDLERFMEAATASAQRAATLTQRLLAFSRRQSLDAKPININALINGLEELVRRSIRENIVLHVDLDKTAKVVLADANQLENAILNLTINARDAMPEGGTLTIQTESFRAGDGGNVAHRDLSPGHYVLISVRDTGVGMSRDILDKVFEPFFTTKPIGQGTGLGLSMVYGFARQSRGHVQIESCPGEGTVVKLYLPVADANAMAVPAPRHASPTTGSGQQVLIVEDDAAVRLLVREVLDDLGYNAIEAAEPQLAIKVLGSDQVLDLMISDVGLPGMNGRQLADVARQHRPELPILFVTGYAENAAIRSRFIGANMDMIMKPFTFEVLAAKVADMLG